jgi:mono/diheme cytochrome c family protein
MKILFLAFLFCASLFAQSGEELFVEKCMICHTKERPSTPQMRQQMVAPPAMGVMFHVKEAFNQDREKAIAFIKDYVYNPSKEKAKCLPRSIKRFGVMPSQKDLVSEDELDKIANYLYENFPPKSFTH